MRRSLRAAVVPVLFTLGFALAPMGFAQQSPSLDRQVQAFSLAVRANDFSFFARMDRLGLGPDTRDPLGNNLLMLGIREGGVQMMLMLLEDPRWRDPNAINHENQLGENALMLAALGGQEPVARRLIALGAQVNRAGWAPLHYAATSGHLPTISLLLEHHAFVDAESPNKTTPLMMATRFNHPQAVKLLLQAGADPTAVNEAGFKARDYAEQANNRDLSFTLSLEEIAFENRKLNLEINTDREVSLEEIVIRSGGSIVLEPGTESGMNIAPPGQDAELFPGVR